MEGTWGVPKIIEGVATMSGDDEGQNQELYFHLLLKSRQRVVYQLVNSLYFKRIKMMFCQKRVQQITR